MRHTYKNECKDSSKAHLWRLPNLHEPYPIHEEQRRGVIVFTLFNSTGRDDTVYHHDAIAGVWAARSWMRNSDAHKYGIRAKFYVENAVRDQAESVFGQNFVDPNDIIYFDGAKFEGDPKTRTGKKCAVFSDEQFSDYDWVFQMDTDLFAMEGKWELPFFERFFDSADPDGIGALYVGIPDGSPPYDNIINKSWITWMLDDNEHDQSLYEDEWRKRILEIANPYVASRFFDSNQWYPEPQGAIEAFPAEHFMANRRGDCEWLANAGRVLQTDEAAISVWSMLGNNLFDIRDKQGLTVVMMDRRLEPQQWEQFLQVTDDNHPFVLHYATSYAEVVWREGIDAI